MNNLEKIYDMVDKRLDEFASADKISNVEELKQIDALTHTMKSIETIMAMRGSQQSYNGPSRAYGGGSSYAQGHETRDWDGYDQGRVPADRYMGGRDPMGTSGHYPEYADPRMYRGEPMGYRR